MPSEVETLRELAKLFWSGKPIPCPQHAGGTLTGSFVQTTFADHIALVCNRGKETLTIPQRPQQKQFFDQQVEGFVESLQRGDAILCYRCQSPLQIAYFAQRVMQRLGAQGIDERMMLARVRAQARGTFGASGL